MGKALIGADIGTSGTKAAVVALDGRVLGEFTQNYPLICKKSGWAEQNPLDWENALYASVSSALRISGVKAEEIAGICVSGLFAGSGVPVDGSGRPVRNAIIWMDRRATEQSAWTRSVFSDEEIFSLTGNRNDAYFGFNKILWIKQNEPDIWKKIRWFLPSNSYIVYKLTGKIAVDYTSAANIGGIYDMKNHNWSGDAMERFGIPMDLFPSEWKKPEEIAGYLTQEAAQKMDLVSGIPVCMGGTDCLFSVLSSGVIQKNVQTAVIGTSINWGIVHEGILKDPELVTMPNAIDPLTTYYTYGGITSAGALCKWFLDTVAPYSARDGKICRTDFAMLEEEADRIPGGSEGILVLPYFMGERSPVWDSNARGVFCGLSMRHTRAHMYRAILESTAFAIRHIRESSRVFQNSGDFCVVSGGACQSNLWMQILADVTGLRIITTSKNAQAPMGDALVAGVATGHIPSYAAAAEWCRYERVFEPDPEAEYFYGLYYEKYKKLYESTIDIVHFLAEFSHL